MTEEDILGAMKEALAKSDDIQPLEETEVPDTLLTKERLQAKAAARKPLSFL